MKKLFWGKIDIAPSWIDYDRPVISTFLFFSDISPKEVQEKEIIVGIVTDIDLLHHVSQKESRSGSSSGGK